MLAGTKVSVVVGVFAVGHCGEVRLRANAFQNSKQFIFAMKAAVGAVADILRAFQFGGFNDTQRDTLILGKADCVIILVARERSRVCDDGQHPLAERLARCIREKSGINPA